MAAEYVEYFPPFGQLGGPVQPWPLSAGINPLDLGAHRGKDLLLVAEPADPNSGLPLGLFAPFGDMLYPEGGNWSWKGVRVTLYPAATTPRSTDNDDTPAATYVHGGLPSAPTIRSSLFDGIDPLSRSRPTAGDIEIADPAGELDYLLNYVWDGAPLTLKRGVRGTPFSTWETVAKFTAANILPNLDSKIIVLRDLAWQLQGSLHAEYYGGTGGLDGDPGLAGRWKPWALGYCNTVPVLINAAAQIMQWSLGSSAAVLDFRHGGVSMPFHADYPTFEALRDAVIPSGHYGTCLAKSLARLNADIEFGIRIDVIGDADTAYGHPTPTKRGEIARRVATTRGTNRIDDTAQIDFTAFSRINARHSAPVGWFFDTEISKAEALDTIMSGILGWWRVRPDGRLAIGFVESPKNSVAITFRYKSEGMGKPRVVAVGPPRAGTQMSYQTNVAPENRSELATVLDEETAASLGRQAQYAASLTPAVSTLYPTSKIVFVGNSGFWLRTDAQTESNRQQGILCIERKRWRWEMQVDPFVDLQGTVAALTEFDRLESEAVKPLLAVGLETSDGDETTFEWWG